ncbi:hypothetical protein M8C21_019470 [Ambrosia artemisiifolia]|uniref:Uncharacterized protein n=1 Tax=Ambrosia artemisiifolia TaxID=4212 RepID=A0AAD5DIB7_AMBAR|nr:hypothetical protein M8C21_019470 [Ambrosia artemisiifolia]
MSSFSILRIRLLSPPLNTDLRSQLLKKIMYSATSGDGGDPSLGRLSSLTTGFDSVPIIGYGGSWVVITVD